MAEYIEKQAFLEHMKGTIRYFAVKFDVESFPAADVAPVRHGEWVITKEYNEVIDTEITKYTCSVCKDYRLSGYGLSKATKYCPNCGAKMDLEAPPHV